MFGEELDCYAASGEGADLDVEEDSWVNHGRCWGWLGVTRGSSLTSRNLDLEHGPLITRNWD